MRRSWETPPAGWVTFALENRQADYQAEQIRYNEKGFASFDIVRKGVRIGHIDLEVPGEHNVANALAAAAVGDVLAAGGAVEKGLDGYTGTERRFEFKEPWAALRWWMITRTILMRYGQTLLAARKLDQKKIWCVFSAPYPIPGPSAPEGVCPGSGPG